MNVRTWTVSDLVGALNAAYHAPAPEPGSAAARVQVAVADRLGCDEDLRAAVWAAWQADLITAGQHVDDAAYWLDVAFVQPCPEDT